jgi:hypothetical protein
MRVLLESFPGCVEITVDVDDDIGRPGEVVQVE